MSEIADAILAVIEARVLYDLARNEEGADGYRWSAIAERQEYERAAERLRQAVASLERL